jgi:ElaB/YqjD/DUF883 family membrane-anchored ribosome-binding protein
MARRKGEKTPPDTPEPNQDGTRGPDGSDQAADQSPEVQAAEDAVRQAEAQLEKARLLYQQVRQQAVDQLKEVRQKTVGDLIDGTLKLVKRYPGPGVLMAALIGFFLGRLFRR